MTVTGSRSGWKLRGLPSMDGEEGAERACSFSREELPAGYRCASLIFPHIRVWTKPGVQKKETSSVYEAFFCLTLYRLGACIRHLCIL